MVLNPACPHPPINRSMKDIRNHGDHATSVTAIAIIIAPPRKRSPCLLMFLFMAIIDAPIRFPIPSAEPSIPPNTVLTDNTSLAITGMKYWIGNTRPFITNETIKTPSTVRFLTEYLMPCTRLSLIGRVRRSSWLRVGSRSLIIKTRATMSNIAIKA